MKTEREWEFELTRSHSHSVLVPGAGAIPVLTLSKGVLGIRPTGRGYSECIIRPQMVDLEWIMGDIPVPSGKISLMLHKKEGGKLTLPTGVKATLSGLRSKNGKIELIGPGLYQVEI